MQSCCILCSNGCGMDVAVRDGRMTVAESQALLRFYKAELDGYTYLSPD